jgi:nicotinamidase/pyrazinamidase
MIDLDQKRDALIVVDMQYDFLPLGALAVPGGADIVAPIMKAMDQFHTCIVTQDWHPRGHISFASTHKAHPFATIDLYGQQQTLWPEHCIRTTPGAGLVNGIEHHPHVALVLRKGMNWRVDSYSAFRENWGPKEGGGARRADTGLMGWCLSRGIRRVFICGLARDYCVKYTALDATVGLSPTVLWDLTRAVHPESDDAVRKELLEHGVRIQEGM